MDPCNCIDVPPSHYSLYSHQNLTCTVCIDLSFRSRGLYYVVSMDMYLVATMFLTVQDLAFSLSRTWQGLVVVWNSLLGHNQVLRFEFPDSVVCVEYLLLALYARVHWSPRRAGASGNAAENVA